MYCRILCQTLDWVVTVRKNEAFGGRDGHRRSAASQRRSAQDRY